MVVVWGDGRSTRRENLDGRVQDDAGGAGSMSAGREGAKWAGARADCRGQPCLARHACLFIVLKSFFMHLLYSFCIYYNYSRILHGPVLRDKLIFSLRPSLPPSLGSIPLQCLRRI